jgi:hypothetical protein
VPADGQRGGRENEEGGGASGRHFRK